MIRVTVAETGEVLMCSEAAVQVDLRLVAAVDGAPLRVPEALGVMTALRDYWRERAIRFETELADARARGAEL